MDFEKNSLKNCTKKAPPQTLYTSREGLFSYQTICGNSP